MAAARMASYTESATTCCGTLIMSVFTVQCSPGDSTATKAASWSFACRYAASKAAMPVASSMRSAGQGAGSGCMRTIVPSARDGTDVDTAGVCLTGTGRPLRQPARRRDSGPGPVEPSRTEKDLGHLRQVPAAPRDGTAGDRPDLRRGRRPARRRPGDQLADGQLDGAHRAVEVQDAVYCLYVGQEAAGRSAGRAIGSLPSKARAGVIRRRASGHCSVRLTPVRTSVGQAECRALQKPARTGRPGAQMRRQGGRGK